MPLSYKLTTFQIPGQKLSNFFVGILVETMTPRGHFEINWPLTYSSWESWVFQTDFLSCGSRFLFPVLSRMYFVRSSMGYTFFFRYSAAWWIHASAQDYLWLCVCLDTLKKSSMYRLKHSDIYSQGGYREESSTRFCTHGDRLFWHKAELLQLNRTQFSSLGIFVSKKVGNRKN